MTVYIAQADDLTQHDAPQTPTHPHPIDGTHEGLRRNCDACDAEDVAESGLSEASR